MSETIRSAKSLADLYTPPLNPTWTNDLTRQAFLPFYPLTSVYHAIKRSIGKRKAEKAKKDDQDTATKEDSVQKKAYIQGFVEQCAELGMKPATAVKLCSKLQGWQ